MELFSEAVIAAYARQVVSNPRLQTRGEVLPDQKQAAEAFRYALLVSMRQCVSNPNMRAIFQQLQQKAYLLTTNMPAANYTDTSRAIETIVEASALVVRNLLRCAPIGDTQDARSVIAACVPPLHVRPKPAPRPTRFSAEAVPFVVVAVVCLGLAYAYKNTTTRVILLLTAVMSMEWTFYTRQVRGAETALAKHKKGFSDKKTDSAHIRAFHFTCGLNGIGNYIACFQQQPDVAGEPPVQNVWGCMFEEAVVGRGFATPDDAYDYWLTNPSLQALDIISRPNGTREYHFYTKVSKECVRLMESIAKSPNRAVIPPLVCPMLEPTTSVSTLSAVRMTDYTFVFSIDGFLFYTKDGEWVRVNSRSIFVADSPNHVGVYMSPPSETVVELQKPIRGTYYYIDASHAGFDGGGDYYYTIYSYRLDTTEKPVLVSSGFKAHNKLSVSNLVEGKGIGPYKTNPKLLRQRNTTLIWDTDSAREDEIQAATEIDTIRSERRLWTMFVALIAGVMALDAAATTWKKK